MNLIFPFVFGFLAAAVGLILPGLINMTAAKVSLTDGKNRAFMYVLGAVTVITMQTYISVICAQYIQKHQEVVILIREVGLGVFLILTVYFLKFAKPPIINNQDENVVRSKRGRFFMGMGISALNILPIPYYAVVSIALASYHLFSFQPYPIYSLVFGVAIGSFTIFYFYVVLFNKLESKDFFINNINRIVGAITGLVSLLTLFNLMKNHIK